MNCYLESESPVTRQSRSRSTISLLLDKPGSPHNHVRPSSAKCLLAAVEVVPLAAGAAPIVVRGLSVGKVVSVLCLHVVEAGGLVEVRSLGVKCRSVLAVKCLENLHIIDRMHDSVCDPSLHQKYKAAQDWGSNG